MALPSGFSYNPSQGMWTNYGYMTPQQVNDYVAGGGTKEGLISNLQREDQPFYSQQFDTITKTPDLIGPDGQQWMAYNAEGQAAGAAGRQASANFYGVPGYQEQLVNGVAYMPRSYGEAVGNFSSEGNGLGELLKQGLAYPLSAYGIGQAGSYLSGLGGSAAPSVPSGGASSASGATYTTPGGLSIGSDLVNAPGSGFMATSALQNGLPAASYLSEGEIAALMASGAGIGDAGAFDQSGSSGTGIPGSGPASQQSYASLYGPAASAGSSFLDSLSKAFPASSLGSLLTGALQGGLGYLGSQQQTQALQDLQNQYLGLGAPYRDMLAQTYQPGYSVWNDSATRDAATQAADAAARSYSAKAGNVFDNPGAQSGIYDAVLRGVALPQLNTTRSQLGTFGQLGMNTAGTAGLSAASQAGGGLDSLGYGLGTALNPQTSIEDLLKKYSITPRLGSGSQLG